MESEIRELKTLEITRLVKDCINEQSYIMKNAVNVKQLIYMLFGETAFEIEFFR